MSEQFLSRYWVVYYLVYLGAVGTLLSLNRGDWQEGSWLTLLAAVFAVSAGIAATTAIVVEFGGRIMLLIPATVRRLRAEGREEGRMKGREEARTEWEAWFKQYQETQEEIWAEWEAWYKRHQEAQASGQEFTEPPPQRKAS